jgi:hypothetical protein
MSILLTALIVVFLVGTTLFLTRDNWFRKKKKPVREDVKSKPTDQKKVEREKKPEKTDKRPIWKLIVVTGVILYVGLALLWGVFSAYHYSFPVNESATQSNTNKVSSGPLTANFSDAPWEVAGPIVCGWESGNGTPGSARQFGEDGKPLRNPTNPAVVGACQINTGDPANAKIIADNHWDVVNSEADNWAMAKHLHGLYGLRPWRASQEHWGPQLVALGFGGGTEQVAYAKTKIPIPVEAPVGRFGEAIKINKGVYFSWEDSKDAFVVQDQNGSIARYDPANGITKENLPYPSSWISFKSLGDKPAAVKLKLARYPLVSMK